MTPLDGRHIGELRNRRSRPFTAWQRFALLNLGLPGFLAWSASAADVNLIWNPSPDARAVGYAVYYGPAGGTSPSRSDVGNTTNAPVNNLQSGLTYSFYVTAYDSAHNEGEPSSVINYTVPVSPSSNTAPVLSPIANRTVTATSNLTFTATAADADMPAQALTFSLGAGAPTGASISSSSGVFSWTPARAQTGTFPVAVSVIDNGTPALSATQMVAITVTAPPNSAPALNPIANPIVAATSNLTFTATATDVDVPAQTLTFSLDAGAPTGASINPSTGVFSWTPTASQVGSYPVTVRVTDSGSPALSASRTSSITVTASSNTAPVLGTLANQSVAATSNLTFTARATDVDVPAQTLTFSLDPGAPTKASIDPRTGVFSWTPTKGQVGSYSVTFRVTDNGSPALSASRTITIAVLASGAKPHVTISPTNQVDLLGPSLSLQPGSQGALTLSFTNLAAYQYQIQTNADLGTTNWGTISTLPPSSSNGVIDLPQNSTNAPRLFYRVLMLSN